MNHSPALPRLHFEDFQVGQRFSSRSHKVDEKQIIEFAKQFDPQPFHMNPKTADNSFFQGLVASGWHTAAITMSLLVDCLPIDGGLIGTSVEMKWLQATRPDDNLRVEGEVIALRASRKYGDRGVMTVRIKTVNQEHKTAQDMTAKMLVFRRPN